MKEKTKKHIIAIANKTKKLAKYLFDICSAYYNKNKVKFLRQAVAFLLLAAIITPMIFLQTENSAAEDELSINATYTGAHGTPHVVTLLSEIEDIQSLANEPISLSQEYINGKAEKKRLKKEAEEKRKEEEAKKNGTYPAPPVTPKEGFVHYDVPLSYEWQVYTYNLCQEYGVSFEVMLGLMNAESSFRFNCSSGVAFGICQIHYCHEEYAKSIGIENYKEPEGNILLAVKFLKGHLKEQNGDYHKALICYNYGSSGGAKKHCFSKGIYQTAYSKKVMAFAHNLKPVK